MNIFKRRRAFSMIEVLVVIAVIAVVAVFVVPSLFGGSHTADLNGATEQIAASLRQAQNQSASQVQDATWGIHFSNATNTAPFYAVFSGTSYATGTVQNVYRLPPTVGFVSSTLAVGATQDIVFSGVSGAASASTTIKLYVISQPSISSTIIIANTGQVAFVTPTTPGSGGSTPTGALGSWQTTTALPTAIEFHAAVAYNGYLYTTGGDTPQGDTSTVYYAPINGNGTLGSWQTTTALPLTMYEHTAVAYNGYIYVAAIETPTG